MEYKDCDIKNYKKIKAIYAGIVLRRVSRLNFPEAPYFEILYLDAEENQWHCGFGSYAFAFVEDWLKSEFEPTYKRIETAITDFISRAEDAEAEQETLQRAMAEYKDRAEKAEKCIAEIQSARGHTRPSYVVDEILRRFYDKKSFNELSQEAQKMYHDILNEDAPKGEQHAADV